MVAFPDVDGYQEWKDKLSQVRGLDITVLLIRQHRKEHIEITPVERYEDPKSHPTFLKLKGLVGVGSLEEQVGMGNLEELDNMKELADVGYWKELALLVNELGLEVEGINRTVPNP